MAVHPRISVNQECSTRLSFAEDVELWRELGVEQVGLISTKLEPFGWDRAVQAVREAGLGVSNVGTEQRLLPNAIDFAAEVGAESVWVTSGGPGARSWEEAADDFCKSIAPAAARARQRGVAFAVEPTNSLRSDCSFLHSLRDSLELARRADIGVVLEILVCWYERGLEKMVRDEVDRLTLVQLCDFEVGTFDTPNRSVLGDGDIPLERLVKLLLDAGYRGHFDIEILGPRIEAEGYAPALRRSLDHAGELLDRLGA